VLKRGGRIRRRPSGLIGLAEQNGSRRKVAVSTASVGTAVSLPAEEGGAESRIDVSG